MQAAQNRTAQPIQSIVDAALYLPNMLGNQENKCRLPKFDNNPNAQSLKSQAHRPQSMYKLGLPQYRDNSLLPSRRINVVLPAPKSPSKNDCRMIFQQIRKLLSQLQEAHAHH